MDLTDRVAVVTGGAHRVGRAIALSLAEAGARVGIVYLSSEDAAVETIAELIAAGAPDADAFRCDVGDATEVTRMVDEVHERLGSIDVLVNSASAFGQDEFPTDDFAVWHSTFDVVVDGAFYCSNAAAADMLENGGGSIVNILDLSAWQPWPGRMAHSVAKASLLALTRQLAVELAPTIRANAVALGPTIPPAKFSEAQIERLRARTLLDRWAGGEEAGRAVRYLVEAEAVTGECLTVDSGEQYGHVRDRFI
jgi:pteridine reductase